MLKLMANVCALPVTAIEAEARAAGLLGARQPLSQCRALRDARLMLKLYVVREGFGADGRWLWTRTLPKQIQETPQTPAQPKKPKKNRKERKKEFRAKKVTRRAEKAADRRARREAARAMTSIAPTSSMDETPSMGETTSMAETSSLASADAPAPALAQQGDKDGNE